MSSKVATVGWTTNAPQPLSATGLNALRVAISRGERGAAVSMISRHPDCLSEISFGEKKKMISDLREHGMDRKTQQVTLDVFNSLSGADRAQLLHELDGGDNDRDLDELVHDRFDDPARRKQMQDVLNLNGRWLNSQGQSEIALVSDYDDTMISQKYDPTGKGFFPGAATLYQELDRGADGTGLEGDCHYVTARSPLWGKSSFLFKGVKNNLLERGFPQGTVEYGGLLGGLFGKDSMEDQKVEDITRLLQLHPQQKFVLFGDNLGRDPQVYRRIQNAFPAQVAAVVIHDAKGTAPVEAGQFFVKNYVEAAVALSKAGLLTEPQVDRVAQKARVEGLPAETVEDALSA